MFGVDHFNGLGNNDTVFVEQEKQKLANIARMESWEMVRDMGDRWIDICVLSRD